MDLEKTEYRIRCEMGACKNLATSTIKMSRVGIKSRVHICKNCMLELYDLIGSNVVPKSLETLRKKDDDYTIAMPSFCDADTEYNSGKIAEKESVKKAKIKKQNLKISDEERE